LTTILRATLAKARSALHYRQFFLLEAHLKPHPKAHRNSEYLATSIKNKWLWVHVGKIVDESHLNLIYSIGTCRVKWRSRVTTSVVVRRRRFGVT
jgi:hypothetical protein